MWRRENSIAHFRTPIIQSAIAVRNGKLAFSGHRTRAQVWDIAKGKMQSEFEKTGEYWQKSIAVSRDGSRVAHTDDERLYIWNSASGALLQTIVLAGNEEWDNPVPVAFSGNGKTVVVAEKRTLSLWSDKGVLRQRANHHSDVIWSLATSPNGSTLASSGVDGIVNFWDADSGVLKVSLAFSPAPNKEIKAKSFDWIAWTPDGFFAGAPGCERFIRHRNGDALFPVTESQKKYYRLAPLQSAFGLRKMDASARSTSKD